MQNDDTLTLIGAETIDSLKPVSSSTCKKLQVTGLKQKSFEHLIGVYGDKFEEIDFFKCPLISDLGCLEQLENIRAISFYWNQRATELWDLSKNKNLKSIVLDDFTRLHSLDDLAKSNTLTDVSFGDRVWSSFVLDSLSPLSNINNLRKLSFSAKKIDDFRISPIADISDLEELEFPTNLFPTEKVAWLTAKIGSKVKSSVLSPYRRIETPIISGEKQIDTFITGKRKPSLDYYVDAKRIEKYVKKFKDLVEFYKSNPNECEP